MQGVNGAQPPLSRRAPAALALLALMLAAGPIGCHAIRLNAAMERVHYAYLELFSKVELGDGEAARAAAGGLASALEDPAIIAYSTEPEYRRLLEETRDAIATFIVDATDQADMKTLLRARANVFESCQTCHQDFRRAVRVFD